MVAAPASTVTCAAAMDGSGKVTARSAAACEEEASALLAEAVVAAVAVAGAAAAADAMHGCGGRSNLVDGNVCFRHHLRRRGCDVVR